MSDEQQSPAERYEAEYAELKVKADDLQAKTNAMIHELARMGGQIDPRQIDAIRLEVLMNHLLGKADESVERLEFEVRFLETVEKAMENTLSGARNQRALAKLHVPNGVKINRDGGLEGS